MRTKRIFLIGYMGSGKTFWGEQLAQILQVPFMDADAMIAQQEGRSVADIFAHKGESYFRACETQLLASLKKTNLFIFATGGGMPCHADNMRVMNELGVTVWLRAKAQTLFARLAQEKEKNARPLLRGTSEEWQDFVRKTLVARAPYYSQARYHVDVEGLTLESLCAQIGL